jgi:DNA-binding CsgD family transcriptional regulator
MWFLTVFGLITRSAAIWALSLPFAISFSTSSSRSDSSVRIDSAMSVSAVDERTRWSTFEAIVGEISEAPTAAERIPVTTSSIDDVVTGIRSAAVGASLISPTIAAKVLQRVRASTPDTEMAESIRTELSDRELQVLKLFANGKDNSQIAAELVISPKTVKNHISNILMKLQIQNRIQAAVYAVRSGLA